MAKRNRVTWRPDWVIECGALHETVYDVQRSVLRLRARCRVALGLRICLQRIPVHRECELGAARPRKPGETLEGRPGGVGVANIALLSEVVVGD